MKEIVKLLNENGYEAFIVGGFVRDYLLGIASKDIDICTNAPINKIMKIFKGRGKAFKEYFSYHILEDGYSYDITTYRKESKYKKNKPVQISVADDLGTDLLRRDFTINTFAIDNEGKLVDILGAKKDLNSRVLKVVGDTNKKFTEDKTRILRAIRFSCTLDFDFDSKILKFFDDNNAHMLNEVPKEFKRKELDKIFDSSNIDRFFYIVRKYNLGKFLNIKADYERVKRTYNKYGIWAQLESDLPFSNKELSIIDSIKKLVSKKDISLSDTRIYPTEVIYNAAGILGIEDKIRVIEEIIKLHSIIEIDVSPDIFLKYVKINDIRKVYRLVERSIMEGYLSNNEEAIERFIKDL